MDLVEVRLGGLDERDAVLGVALALSETVETEMTSPSSAPTWKSIVDAPLSSALPLNSAEVPMRSISAASALTSVWIDACALVDIVPFLYWTASSRTRCSIEWTSSRFASAVWTSEMPSSVLRWPWARPLIWPRIFSEMPRPAASSAARLMRMPEESFSIDFVCAVELADSRRWAWNASGLFAMRRDMMDFLLQLKWNGAGDGTAGPGRRGGPRAAGPARTRRRRCSPP